MNNKIKGILLGVVGGLMIALAFWFVGGDEALKFFMVFLLIVGGVTNIVLGSMKYLD